ncbi:MAG TPA: lactonase family protein [Sediminibacterium sp.]|nr:lactonase family protein [Sediminibacterium sp.]
MLPFSRLLNRPFFFWILMVQFMCTRNFAQVNNKTTYQFRLMIGTYTNSGKSEGLYTYRFDSKDGSAVFLNKTNASDPSFLTMGKNNRVLYAVNELGGGKGSVSAFRYTHNTGEITLLTTVPSGGDHPCYITTDRKHRYAFVANYTGGSFSAIRINTNGFPDSSIQTILHNGKSVTARQEKAHVHSTVLSPDEKYLLVQDLGTDQITVYAVDLTASANPVTTAPVSVYNTVPGSGPRHLVFHPNKKWAYVVQELNGTVTGLSFKKGILKKIQDISLHAAAVTGNDGAADIHISPDGKFLYASNRGTFNEITVYSISAKGELNYRGTVSTLGKAPRNFCIDPSGNFLLVGNHLSDEIVVFKRNQSTGLLTDTGKRIQTGAPVCIRFFQD